ncbi:MAG TPA: purine-nucleoside phosphorylase, partial [Bacteroidetes bacterium]|nr:purine-nucleoside phosphorylase [Bacteroidota bacterium]
MHDISERINEAYNFLSQNIGGFDPEIGLILGSGLGVLADEIIDPVCIPYGDIPSFPVSTVEGHSGQLVIGKLEGKTVLAMQGRFHYYEGYSMQEITIPVRVMSKLGIKKMIITNAAGGVNESFKAGDLMIINDHINFSGDNPLIGPNLDEFGPRFPDMSSPYNEELIRVLKNVAKQQNISLKEGVYFYSQGPSYETPSEVNMARICGADAVGMSTVPEVIVGVHAGMKILGI